MMSPIFSAKRRSFASFSVSARQETAPGRLMPLLLNGATDDHAGANTGGGYLNSFEADLTVVEQELAEHVAGQTLVGGATEFLRYLNVFRK